MSLSMMLLEKGLLPDFMIRAAIRGLLKKKLEAESRGGVAAQEERFGQFVERVQKSPISIHADAANKQHYELPPVFFEKILGPRMKYSSGYWREGVDEIEKSEEDMLEITVERAQIQSGQRILELGCGWGSLSLYMAQRFPLSSITAVSNSRPQKEYIDRKAAALGLRNLSVVTAEMSRLELPDKFDRIVTVEMFEHMRNYSKLFEKVSGFLKSDGKMFVHVFTHRQFAYFYEENDPNDWIARYFFTGGTMPSDRLFFYFQDHFMIEAHWRVEGAHYRKTCRAWLDRMDREKAAVWTVLQEVYGADAVKWRNYWRVFFMACEELFGYREGSEWMVSHYLFLKK